MHPEPDPVGPNQESVWDFPRPAVAERTDAHIRIVHAGQIVADTRRAVRTLETSHPPSYYIPPGDIDRDRLFSNPHRSLCEWKGQARYVDCVIGNERLAAVGWSYADPMPAFAALKDHIAFYPAPFDRCEVDGERVTAQPGGFYGGWITSAFAGPFKGGPGSRFW